MRSRRQGLKDFEHGSQEIIINRIKAVRQTSSSTCGHANLIVKLVTARPQVCVAITPYSIIYHQAILQLPCFHVFSVRMIQKNNVLHLCLYCPFSK
jgi:hypothetical protein